MTQPGMPTAVIAAQVRALRKAREWSAQRLAEQMTDEGIPWADRNVVVNLETGRRRSVSVDEWLALARVLGVAPVHLLLPGSDVAGVAVTPKMTLSSEEARKWLCGEPPVDDVRQRLAALEAMVTFLSGSLKAAGVDVEGGYSFTQAPGEPAKWLKGGPGDGLDS